MSGSTDNITEEEAAADVLCCASCGIAEVDNVKLKPCDGCDLDLARYCSDECQQDHWPEHEAKCTERAAELRDELLFRQPESSHLGDCPICCLPLGLSLGFSTDLSKTAIYPCCSTWICKGCAYANDLRQRREKMQGTCPFCRHPHPKTMEEVEKKLMKRVAANDPDAMRQIGFMRFGGKEYNAAFEYFTKAAELGDADGHFLLSFAYGEGLGVEKDEERELYHLEEAAIRGHPSARYNLGNHEARNERFERAVKHYIIAANLGFNDSTTVLKEYYKNGHVSKEDFAAALRAHQAAVNATKSPQREAAEKDGVKWR